MIYHGENYVFDERDSLILCALLDGYTRAPHKTMKEFVQNLVNAQDIYEQRRLVHLGLIGLGYGDRDPQVVAALHSLELAGADFKAAMNKIMRFIHPDTLRFPAGKFTEGRAFALNALRGQLEPGMIMDNRALLAGALRALTDFPPSIQDVGGDLSAWTNATQLRRFFDALVLHAPNPDYVGGDPEAAERERVRREAAERERIRHEQEQERIRHEAEERERMNREAAERERVRHEQEQERIRHEQEQERIRREQEQERIRREAEEAERLRRGAPEGAGGAALTPEEIRALKEQRARQAMSGRSKLRRG